MFRKILFILFFILLFAKCDNETPTVPETSRIVIQGHLHARQPVRDIRITKLFNYTHGLTNFTITPITNATVTLKRGDNTYCLSHYNNGYYQSVDTNLIVNPGDVFTIEVTYQGQTATAQTMVPSDIQITHLSKDTLFLIDDHNPEKREEYKEDAVHIEWTSDQDPKAYYFPVITYMDTTQSQHYIMKMEPYSDYYDYPEDIKNKWSWLSRWSINQYYLYPWITFYTSDYKIYNQEGRYCFHVYHVNYNYIQLYDDSAYTYNESHSNITNGFGFFAAMNSDSISFYVKKKPL